MRADNIFVPYTLDKRTGEVTYHTLNSSINCAYPSDIVHSMRTTIENGRGRYRREAPRTKNGEEIILYHMWQNFGESLSPVVANEIGRKLAEEVFPDFPVVILRIQILHIHTTILLFCSVEYSWKEME